MEGHFWLVDHQEKLDFFIEFAKLALKNGEHHMYSIKGVGRSERQNNAMHLWFRQIAATLNDGGFEFPHPLNPGINIPFTEHLIKEIVYKPIIKAMYDKNTTSGLTGRELSEAAEVLIRWLTEKHNVYIPFPQKLRDEL